MGIHYDYKSTRGMKAMEKQAKREKKLAERKAKRAAKEGFQKKDDKIKGISLSSDFINAGWAQTQEIRNALKDFKNSGKFIYAYSNYF